MSASKAFAEIVDVANELRTTVKHNMAPILNAFTTIRNEGASGDEADLLFNSYIVTADHFASIMDMTFYMLEDQIGSTFSASWESLHPDLTPGEEEEPTE